MSKQAHALAIALGKELAKSEMRVLELQAELVALNQINQSNLGVSAARAAQRNVLAADNERLHNRIAELETTAVQQVTDFKREIEMVRQLKAENERLRPDAERIAELGGALGEMTTRRNLAENEVRRVQAGNERLRFTILDHCCSCGAGINDQPAHAPYCTAIKIIQGAAMEGE